MTWTFSGRGGILDTALTVCLGRRPVLPRPSGTVVDESRGHLSATQDCQDPQNLG